MNTRGKIILWTLLVGVVALWTAILWKPTSEFVRQLEVQRAAAETVDLPREEIVGQPDPDGPVVCTHDEAEGLKCDGLIVAGKKK
jgi:hypothetical protein